MKKFILIILVLILPIISKAQDSLQYKAFLSFGTNLAINGIIYSFDKVTGSHTLDYPFLRGFNLKWEMDNSYACTNFFGHPFHGATYHLMGRLYGLSYLETVPLNALGSAAWELGAEKENPSINDLLVTTFGGALVGEFLYNAYTNRKQLLENVGFHIGTHYIGLSFNDEKYEMNLQVSYNERVFVKEFYIIGNLFNYEINNKLDLGIYLHIQYKSDKPDRNCDPNYMFAEGVAYGLGLKYHTDLFNVNSYINGIALGAYQTEGNKYNMKPGASFKNHISSKGNNFKVGNKTEYYIFPHKLIFLISPYVKYRLFNNIWIKGQYELNKFILEFSYENNKK